MAILFDRRPTLASWPKRIYAWPELPEPFRPALAAWRSQGLPPGNVTYIPRINQYGGSPEFATAWLGDEVLLQTAQGGSVQCLAFCGADVAVMDYYVQLLRCTVTVTLSEARSGLQSSFSYNKTKEDQLFPVLNLAMGNTSDSVPRAGHPDTPALQQLLQDSYAMYNLSKLCYRFGPEIQEFLFWVGRNRGLARLNQPKPEYFVARMERGIACVQKDFYGTRLVCVRWEYLRNFQVVQERGRPILCLESTAGPAARFPLLPEQQAAAAAFLAALPADTRRDGTSKSRI